MLEIIGPDNITDAVLRNEMLQVRGIVRELDGLASKVEEVSESFNRQANNFKRRVRRYAKQNGIQSPVEKRLVSIYPFDFSRSTRCDVARLDLQKFKRIPEYHQNAIMTLECEYSGMLEPLEMKAKAIMKDHSELYGMLLDKTIVKRPFYQSEEYPVALLCINPPGEHEYVLLEADFLDKRVIRIADMHIPTMQLSHHDEARLVDIARTNCINVYAVHHFSEIISAEEMMEHVVLQFHARYASKGESLKRWRVQQLIDNALFARRMDEDNQDIIAKGYRRK